MQLTIIIPFYNGQRFIDRLLSSLPKQYPVLLIDDQSYAPYQSKNYPQVTYHWMEKKGYFTGAVNAGMSMTQGDVLILNQDAWFEGSEWISFLAQHKDEYGIIGDDIRGKHPAWPHGYVRGTFMYIRRDVIDSIGLMNEVDYPLWGSTCEYQLRAIRAGFKVMPSRAIPGFKHDRKGWAGDSIKEVVYAEPEKRGLFIRTPPEISIVATYYNYGRYAQDLVNSLMGGNTCLGKFKQQSFASFELILVNDASTDGETHEILSSLEDRWKGIRYINRDKNGGTAAANNTGISKAYGRYITILCGDDMRAEGSLEKLYRAQLEYPHSFIYDDVHCFSGGAYRDDIKIGVSDFDFDRLLYKNHIHAGIMFPKEAWVEAGGYPELFGDGREDWAMNIALSRVCYCGVRINNPGYLYRREKQNRSLTNTTRVHHQGFLAKLQAMFPELYRGEKPMCGGGCGGRRANRPPAPKSSKAKINYGKMEIADMANLVIVEYVGKSYGTQTFYGITTGSRYVAGLTRSRVAVDKRDLYGTQTRPGILELRENGKNIFRVYHMPPPHKEVAVKAEPAPDAVKVETDAPPELEEETFESQVANATLPKIKKMGLSQSEAKLWLKAERSGKNRTAIINYLEKYA